jgi:hypothetical protein
MAIGNGCSVLKRGRQQEIYSDTKRRNELFSDASKQQTLVERDGCQHWIHALKWERKCALEVELQIGAKSLESL